METYAWIRDALKRRGKTRSGLARALGIHPAQITKMLRGDRGVKAHEIAIISLYIGEPIPTQGSISPQEAIVARVRLDGTLALGVWREPMLQVAHADIDMVVIPWVPNPLYQGLDQYARLVENLQSDEVQTGDYAIFVPYFQIAKTPRDGDMAHVVCRRDTLEEHTLRLVVVTPKRVELHCEGRPDRTVVWRRNDPSVEIQGLYIGAFRPPRQRRR